MVRAVVPCDSGKARLERQPMTAPASTFASADEPAPSPPSDRLYQTVVRDALRGAGTSVWEWDLTSDRIAGFDDGLALLGYAPGDIERTQQAWDQVIHPDDLAANHAAYLRHARGEAPAYESEYRARAKDGSWHWISERGQVLEWTAERAPRRMVGTLSIIDDRKRVESAAGELLDRLQQIARSAPGVLFQYRSTRQGGCFLYVSERSTELLGLPPQQLMHDSSAWHALMAPIDRDRVALDAASAARNLEPWLTEYRIEHPDTGTRWLRVTSTSRVEADGSTLWHGYIEDITESRQLEQMREEAAAARAANSAKTEFLARMSHELRTPLNAVLGFAQLMEMDTREPLTTEQRRRVGFIRDAGTHLLQMIGDLLDLTRIESGKLALSLGPLAIEPLLNECLEMLRPQADAGQVRLLPLQAPAGLKVVADATRLRQVLINLMSNAVKYNRRAGTVQVILQGMPGQVLLQVVDTGVGISPADLPRLFEPFNRLGHGHSKIEGTGIGLAVTQRLIDLMGGRIDVCSTVGMGSTFSVTLPAAHPARKVQSVSLPT
jgi:PAS domain S-box-containing protein